MTAISQKDSGHINFVEPENIYKVTTADGDIAREYQNHTTEAGSKSGFLPSLLADAERLAEHSTATYHEKYTNKPGPTLATRTRTLGQRLEDARNEPPLQQLFGGLWETPGIAILAGDTGVGKSVLAVHIARLIASGATELLGLPCVVQKAVLYYDFELTDRQLLKRFANLPLVDGLFFGDMNPASEDAEAFTFEHIVADLDRTGAQVIILDNITALALKTTADADVSMGIMKGLKRLQSERGISSLVLAHTPKLPPGTPLTLNQLAGSKHLSNFADSVFFIGRSAQGQHTRYVKQAKNRTDEEMLGVLVCELGGEDGCLGFTLVGQEEENAHLDTPIDQRSNRVPRKAELAEIIAALPAALAQPQPAGRLAKQLAEQFGATTRTVMDRVKDLYESGGAVPVAEQLHTLYREQQGREAMYSLRPLQVTA